MRGKNSILRLLRQCLLVLGLATLAVCSDSRSEEAGGFDRVQLPGNLTAATADLSVEGRLRGGKPIYIDLESIKKMPAISFTTDDPWDKAERKYTGVSLRDLLDYLGVEDQATSLQVIAANGYESFIKLEDIRRFEYILCYMEDEVLLTEQADVVNRGSLIIAINFDKHKDVSIELFKHQLVWQVIKFIVS